MPISWRTTTTMMNEKRFWASESYSKTLRTSPGWMSWFLRFLCRNNWRMNGNELSVWRKPARSVERNEGAQTQQPDLHAPRFRVDEVTSGEVHSRTLPQRLYRLR